MSYTVDKPRPCKRCGCDTYRRERNTRDPLCISCSIQKATDMQIQFANRSGPLYDKWLDGIAKFAERQARTRVTPYNLPEETDSRS